MFTLVPRGPFSLAASIKFLEPDLVPAVRAQVERILSLDVDGSGFPAVGERDPVVGEIQRRYPGLRPVGFWSPYEAAAWTIIGHRIRITQAAAIKARMAEELGEPVSFGGRVVHAFPSPQRLAGLGTFPGLAGRKPEWLRWKPYRTWVALLMRTQLEYETGEITGRRPHACTR